MVRPKRRTSAARPLPSVRVGAIAAIAALALAGCGTAASGEGHAAVSERAAPARLDDAADERAATRSRADVGPSRAITLATAAVDGGRVFDMELDRERGRLLWEVDVASSGKDYDVKLNARSGKVVRVKVDRTPDQGMRLLKVAKVRAAKAVRTATAAVKRADLQAIELDRWRGRVVWEAEVTTASGTEYDVKVNARSGKVVSKKVDD